MLFHFIAYCDVLPFGKVFAQCNADIFISIFCNFYIKNSIPKLLEGKMLPQSPEGESLTLILLSVHNK